MTSVSRVLLIARHFPPLGGAGVHRSVGTARHLGSFGYSPVVVTGPGAPRDRWDSHDAELMRRIPADVEVHRVRGLEPLARTGIAARVSRLRPGVADWVRWWIDEATELGKRVGAGAGVVLTSCAPYETAWAGARVASHLGTPWIADLEDPWALDEMRVYPTAVHRALALREMRRALSSAAAIVMAAPEAAIRLRREMPELAERVHSIPIGFDRDDFTTPPAPAEPGVFRIVHTGSMHTDFGLHLRRSHRRRRLLGGMTQGLDVLTRSHVFLIDAIASLIERDPSLRGAVELHLAGSLTESDRAIAAPHEFVRMRGLLSHAETVALMRSADLLFLPMHDLPSGSRAGLVPYKTFEYLGARRPILAAVPEGDVRDMLSSFDHVSLVRPSDTAGMAAAIRQRLEHPQGDSPNREDDRLRALERRRSVARIAAVLDDVLRRSTRAGTSARLSSTTALQDSS
jgi:glycosyltransferase involved in cell wall biosynthesis